MNFLTILQQIIIFAGKLLLLLKSECNETSQCIKTIKFNPSDYLYVHFMRYTFDSKTNTSKKNTNEEEISYELIHEVNSFYLQKIFDVYTLSLIIYHIGGTTQSGHFITELFSSEKSKIENEMKKIVGIILMMIKLLRYHFHHVILYQILGFNKSAINPVKYRLYVEVQLQINLHSVIPQKHRTCC